MVAKRFQIKRPSSRSPGLRLQFFHLLTGLEDRGPHWGHDWSCGRALETQRQLADPLEMLMLLPRQSGNIEHLCFGSVSIALVVLHKRGEIQRRVYHTFIYFCNVSARLWPPPMQQCLCPINWRSSQYPKCVYTTREFEGHTPDVVGFLALRAFLPPRKTEPLIAMK